MVFFLTKEETFPFQNGKLKVMKAAIHMQLIVLMLITHLELKAGDTYERWKIKQLDRSNHTYVLAPFPVKRIASSSASVLVNQKQIPDPHLATLRRTQIVGFSMVPLGAGAIAGGSYLIYKGASDLKQQKNIENITPEKEQKKHDVMLVSAGAALAAVGLAISGGGLVLGISSTVRRNKFCQGTHGVYLKTNTKGISVAYKF